MALSSVIVLATLAAAIAVVVACLKDGIKADFSVYLLRLITWGVQSNARRFLPSDQVDGFLDWFEDEVLTMQEEGGSGIGVALLFLCFTGPHAMLRAWVGTKTKM